MNYKKFFKIVGATVGSFVLLLTIFLGVYIFINRDKGVFELATKFSDLFPISSQYKKRVNFLLLGLDNDRTRTDVDIFASYQPAEKKMDVIQLPRDTRIVLDESDRVAIKDNDYADLKNVPHKAMKLTEAHAYGGVGLTKYVVEKLLNKTPVNYYFKIDFTAFKDIVDAVDGIDINVPVDMYKSDPTQNLHIALKKGFQHLNGDKAEQFVRFRGYPTGDLGRIKAQQAFLLTLGKKVASSEGIKNIIPIIKTINKYSKNDMSASAVMSYGRQALKMDVDNVKFYSLPGEAKWINRVSYFVCDEEKTKTLLHNIMKGKTSDDSSDISSHNSDNKEAKPQLSNSEINVEVLNSTKINGLAKKVADRLQNEGFRISYVGNWGKGEYKKTRIFNNNSDRDGTRNVKSVIGKGKISQNSNDSTDNKDADVILIIGKDMENFK